MFAGARAPSNELLPPWLGSACAVLLGAGIAAVIGSLIGVALGVGAAALLHHLLGRLEPRASRDRRIAIARQLPEAADLLAATLASGAPPARACSAVATGIDEPLSSMLGRVSASLNFGASSTEAWADADPEGGPRGALSRIYPIGILGGADRGRAGGDRSRPSTASSARGRGCRAFGGGAGGGTPCRLFPPRVPACRHDAGDRIHGRSGARPVIPPCRRFPQGSQAPGRLPQGRCVMFLATPLRTHSRHANRQASRPFVGRTIRSKNWGNVCDTSLLG